MALAWTIEKEEDAVQIQTTLLGLQIVGMAIGISEAYALIQAGSTFARILGGFILLNETVLQLLNPATINTSLKNAKVPNLVADIMSGSLTAVQTVGLAADLASGDILAASKATDLAASMKYSKKHYDCLLYTSPSPRDRG